MPLPLMDSERALPLLLAIVALQFTVYRSGISGPPARSLYQIPIEPRRLLELLAVAVRRRQFFGQVTTLPGEEIRLIITILEVPRRRSSLHIRLGGVGLAFADADVLHPDVVDDVPDPSPLAGSWVA